MDTLDFTFMAELVKSLELALLELPPARPNHKYVARLSASSVSALI